MTQIDFTTWTDEALDIAAYPFTSRGYTLRNADGSLGEMTDSMRAFGKCVVAELRSRRRAL